MHRFIGQHKIYFFFERQQNKKISWTSAVLRFMKHSLYFFERFFAIRKGRFRVLFSVKRNASYIWLYDRKRSTIWKRSSFGFLRRRFFHDTFTNETKKKDAVLLLLKFTENEGSFAFVWIEPHPSKKIGDISSNAKNFELPAGNFRALFCGNFELYSR